jgi:hypothetical protein
MRQTRLAIWLVLCGGCLALVPLKPDGGILFVFPLLLLTFPAGFAGEMVFARLYDLAGKSFGWEALEGMPATISYVGALWVLMVGAGYLQWFVLVPWIARKWDRLAERKVEE